MPLLWPWGTTGNKKGNKRSPPVSPSASAFSKGNALLLSLVKIRKGHWLIAHVATPDTADAIAVLTTNYQPPKVNCAWTPFSSGPPVFQCHRYSNPAHPPPVTVRVLQIRDVLIKIRGLPTDVSHSLDVTFVKNWEEWGQRLFYTPKIKTKLTILLTTVFLFIPTKENKMVSKGQFTN